MGRRLPILTIVLLIALFAVNATAEPDDDAARQEQLTARREALARQREHYNLALRALPPLVEHRMSRIMELRVEHGNLALHTFLTPTPNYLNHRADIEGFSSPAFVTYSETMPNSPGDRQFEFKLEYYPDAVTNGRVDLVWRAGGSLPAEFSLESTETTADRFTRVQYTQGSDQVVLIALGSDGAVGRDAENVSLVERDFATLRRRHPSDVEKWLRPVFHRLRQDAVFAADADAAWQVLLPDWPVEANVESRVRATVPLLNDRRWQERNRAADELARLGRDGATAILRLDRRGLTLEQNIALDEVVSRFSPLPPGEVAPLRNNPNFLLDCEYCDDAVVRKLAIARLARLVGHPLDFNPDLPEGPRTDAIERIRRLLSNSATSR